MQSLEDWKLLVGLVATVVGGLWTLFVYFDKKRSAAVDPAKEAAGTGTPTGAGLSPGAVSVLLAGLVLIGWAIFVGGDRSRIETRIEAGDCGTAVGGSIVGSTFEKNC
jgi:hypothetical protein